MEISKIDTSNTEFQNALQLIQYTHNSVFLTGKAGTGKSTFLKYVCANTKKKHVVLAPTGIAAINAGGSTLHSFFKLPFYPLVPDDARFSSQRRIKDFLKYNSERVKMLQEVELIIIDEISMVRADIIDFIDKVLRIYCRNMRTPFAGKQMLFVGDVFQLEPVLKNDERDMLRPYYPTPYFFNAEVFKSMELVSIELTKVYRQNDPAFVSVLNNIRTNRTTEHDLQLLNTRYTEHIRENEGFDQSGKLFVTLCTRRDSVDYINQSKLDAIDEEPYTFKGEICGEFPESSLPTLKELTIKKGAQVLFIKNDFEKRWVNGTLGIVRDIDIDNDALFIETEQGDCFWVTKDKWSNVRYTYNETEKKIEEEELGTFSQFPIKLAWAITIHKSQGLTFSRVVIDFSGGVFAGGQAYVALSRCTSLEGIQLKTEIQRRDIFVRPEILTFAQNFNNTQAMQRALKQAQADVLYKETVEAFNKGDFELCLSKFYKAIHTRYDIEKPNSIRFIRRKLNTINSLKAENKRLREELSQRNQHLNKYALEYVQLGNDCITQAHNAKAAIKNYNKALKLNPNCIDALVRKGITLMNTGNTAEAEQELNKAVELSPISFMALYNRGKLNMQLERYEMAVSDFDKCVSIKPKHANAHQLFGNALNELGNEEAAQIQWAIANELRKKN